MRKCCLILAKVQLAFDNNDRRSVLSFTLSAAFLLPYSAKSSLQKDSGLCAAYYNGLLILLEGFTSILAFNYYITLI